MRSGSPVLGVGLDLAKAGIVSATKQEREAIWCVADLAAAPFRNRSFDAILNILSPSNYAEFERLLSDDGIVLKVIPKSGYLKELRGFCMTAWTNKPIRARMRLSGSRLISI